MSLPRTTSRPLPDIRFSRGTPFRTAREHREALSLIRRLAVSAGAAVAEEALSAATLEALNGGRSAARVFKLTPFFGPDRQAKGSPVILKIAPRAEGVREKANYDKFVRRALPAGCRPDLLAFGWTGAYSGLCYSFVGGSGGSRIDTLTDCLQRGDAKKLDLVLRRIFAPMRDTWYSPALIRAERDIARRYLRSVFHRHRARRPQPKRPCGRAPHDTSTPGRRTDGMSSATCHFPRRARHCSHPAESAPTAVASFTAISIRTISSSLTIRSAWRSSTSRRPDVDMCMRT